ncbi:hypothetical protein LXL04_028831 [Taraxacum kok-saghyz]
MEVYRLWVLPFFYLLISYGAEVVAIKRHGLQSLVSQPYRTSYHFQPSENWMNGPMYYKGVYHFFYQYNPYGALWGNISWGHAISYDLINWLHLDIALMPDQPYDINGCWSGSATISPNGKPMILYTGGDTKKHQVQNLAFPKNVSDPLLIEWVKSSHNPLLTPPKGIDTSSYRDPSTAWMGTDGEWRVVIGSEIDHHGYAILYKSKDFIRWSRASKALHFSNKTMMWECPDFFPVTVNGKNGLDTSVVGKNVRHVLKASFSSHDYYIVGNYDPKTDQYDVGTDFMDSNDVSLRYDYGKFYASKSFYDGGKKRRILWSWISEGDGDSNDIKKGWSGLQSIPRSIWLSKNGKQLVQWPIKELEKLRTKKVHYVNKELRGGSMLEISGITASQADIEVTFSLLNLSEAYLLKEVVDPQLLCTKYNVSVSGSLGPFGLLILASKDLREYTAVFFRVFRVNNSFHLLMCADQSRSSLRPEVEKSIYGAFLDLDPRPTKISLRSLIDHSIIESFGGDGLACITSRVYPKLAIEGQAHLYAFNNGTQSLSISSLSAWSMKRAQIVPIGKRRKPIK